MLKATTSQSSVQRSGSMRKFTGDNQNIQVFVRVRPLNDNEKEKQSFSVVDCPDNRDLVVKDRATGSKVFSFDRVFGPDTKQVDVYKTVVHPLIDEVLKGYNCTVFAYGQTSSGKTYTMAGESRSKEASFGLDPHLGIVPRAIAELFDALRLLDETDYTVRVSLIELYNEDLFDLLSDDQASTLKVYDDPAKKGALIIKGLEEILVSTKEEVLHLMDIGADKRKTAETLMNTNSSRSHTVFTVTVTVHHPIKESNRNGEELIKIGKLNFVDLAGSENIRRSGAVEKQAREAGSINQSLLTLGRVITALVDKSPHIPYRESKLTRLLQDSLGGKTKTSLIATISPASVNLEESLNTLDYAYRAKNIMNRPEINQKLSKKAILKALTEENERLRRQLHAAREGEGFYILVDEYSNLNQRIETQRLDLVSQTMQLRSLQNLLNAKDAEIAILTLSVKKSSEELMVANQVIAETKLKLADASSAIGKLEFETTEKENLVYQHEATQRKLSLEANALLSTTNETTTHLDTVFDKLEMRRKLDQENLEAGRTMQKNFDEQMNFICSSIHNFRLEHVQFCGIQRMQLDTLLAENQKYFDEIKSRVDNFLGNISQLRNNSLLEIHDRTSDLHNFYNQISIDVKKVSDTNCLDLESFAKETISDKLNVVMKDLIQVKKTIENMSTLFGKTLNSQCEVITDYVIQRLNKLEENRQSMEEVLSLQIDVVGATARGIKLHQKETELRNASIISIAEIIMSQCKNLIEAEANYKHSVTNNAVNLLNKLSTSKNNIQTCLDDLRLHTNTEENCSLRTFTMNVTSEAQATLQTDMTKILESYSNQVEEMEQLRNAILDKVEWQKGEWKSTVALLDTRKNETEHSFTQWAEKYKNVENMEREVSANEAACVREAADNCCLSLSNFVTSEKENISLGCNNLSNWAEQNEKLLQNQNLRLSKFWENEYKIVETTGNTPKRKEYQYPKVLTTMTRALQNHASNTLRLSGYGDESGISSTSSSQTTSPITPNVTF